MFDLEGLEGVFSDVRLIGELSLVDPGRGGALVCQPVLPAIQTIIDQTNSSRVLLYILVATLRTSCPPCRPPPRAAP